MKKASKQLGKKNKSQDKGGQGYDLIQNNDSAEAAKILAIRQKFKKIVETPVESIEALVQNNVPPQCLLHNNILTLYCQFDRKPICAICMYQSDTHRKHKVLPLTKAMNYIKEDRASYEIKIQKNISECSVISRKLQQAMIKNESYYPSIINRLKQFYQNTIGMLKNKENEQVNQVLQLKQKMKKQIIVLDQEVKKIGAFLISKLKSIQKVQTDDYILSKRNVLQILIRVNTMISNDLTEVFPEDETSKSFINFNLFTDIYQMLKTQLVIVSPGASVKQPNKNYLITSPRGFSPNIKFRSNQRSKKVLSVQRNRTISEKKCKKEVKFILT